jgi:hypothetical protein
MVANGKSDMGATFGDTVASRRTLLLGGGALLGLGAL